MASLGSMKQLRQSRHKWDKEPKPGEWAKCEKCHTRQFHQPGNHVKVFCLPGSDVRQNNRPPCKPKTNG